MDTENSVDALLNCSYNLPMKQGYSLYEEGGIAMTDKEKKEMYKKKVKKLNKSKFKNRLKKLGLVGVIIAVMGVIGAACLFYGGSTPKKNAYVGKILSITALEEKKETVPQIKRLTYNDMLIVCAVKKFGFLVFTVLPSGTDRMNDVLGLQMKTRRDDGRTGITMANLIASILQLVIPRLFENRSADASACPEPFICRVNDRVGIKICNADFPDFYDAHIRPLHTRNPITARACRSRPVALRDHSPGLPVALNVPP